MRPRVPRVITFPGPNDKPSWEPITTCPFCLVDFKNRFAYKHHYVINDDCMNALWDAEGNYEILNNA